MVHQCNDLMTRKAVMSDTSTEYRKPGKYLLDSTFFVAFELAHEGLKEGLREASCLNCTQYRVLVKLAAAEPEPIGQKNLGIILDLKPNVITHAVNTLENAGFVERIHTPGKRGSRVRVLEAGIKHIEQANPAIIAQLYRIFPTQTAPFRSICEAAVMAGATIEPPLSREMSRKFFASRALASFEVLRKRIEKALEESCHGATFSECRVLQRLGEVGYPMRIVDLARQLKLTSATAVRATDRLAERGWGRAHERARRSARRCTWPAPTRGAICRMLCSRALTASPRSTCGAALPPRSAAISPCRPCGDGRPAATRRGRALEHPRAAAALEAVTRGLVPPRQYRSRSDPPHRPRLHI